MTWYDRDLALHRHRSVEDEQDARRGHTGCDTGEQDKLTDHELGLLLPADLREVIDHRALRSTVPWGRNVQLGNLPSADGAVSVAPCGRCWLSSSWLVLRMRTQTTMYRRPRHRARRQRPAIARKRARSASASSSVSRRVSREALSQGRQGDPGRGRVRLHRQRRAGARRVRVAPVDPAGARHVRAAGLLGPGTASSSTAAVAAMIQHVALGLRGVVGMLFDFKDVPLDVFVEVAGVLEYDFAEGWGLPSTPAPACATTSERARRADAQTADGVTLRIDRVAAAASGAAPSVLHAMMTDGRYFGARKRRAFAAPLADAGLDVYVADFRGHGRSRAAACRRETTGASTISSSSICRRSSRCDRRPRAAILGHSLGGLVACGGSRSAHCLARAARARRRACGSAGRSSGAR